MWTKGKTPWVPNPKGSYNGLGRKPERPISFYYYTIVY